MTLRRIHPRARREAGWGDGGGSVLQPRLEISEQGELDAAEALGGEGLLEEAADTAGTCHVVVVVTFEPLPLGATVWW